MYKISVVPPDLRHEETIIQAAIALDSLQKTINSVFEHIDARTQRNNAKVQELSERIAKAQAKVRGLVGTKKAIKIYAPARFPATQVLSDIPQTFAMAAPTDLTSSSEMTDGEQAMNTAAAAYEVQSRVEAPSTQTLQDKLVFFHVRSKEASSSKASVSNSHGLGTIPEHLRSANALLVFNTDELSYDANGFEKDTWKRAKLFKSQRMRSQGAQNGMQKQLLEPAPHSLVNRNQRTAIVSGLRYTPKLNEAPEIDLPLDLPDLPGIADDIHFEGKAHQQIAPSLFIDNLPDLPELQEELDTQTVQTEQKEENSQPTSVDAANSESIPLADHKPTVTATKSDVDRAPPPPPPPPPPPSQQYQLPKVQSLSGDTAPGADSRSELMDAIRKAGGARGGRLRTAPAAAPIDTVDNRNSATAKATSEEKAPARGDLMADLHHKLQMRRKGISGAKASGNVESGNTVISRLSALIPAPTPRKQHSDDEDEDNDDDNDADWAD